MTEETIHPHISWCWKIHGRQRTFLTKIHASVVFRRVLFQESGFRKMVAISYLIYTCVFRFWRCFCGPSGVSPKDPIQSNAALAKCIRCLPNPISSAEQKRGLIPPPRALACKAAVWLRSWSVRHKTWSGARAKVADLCSLPCPHKDAHNS